jgi:predicted phosphoribosyltransferase
MEIHATRPINPFMGRSDPGYEGLFRDREDAGSQLSPLLDHYRQEEPIVLALPRGGVPVAFPIAELLNAELDVLPVRKIGCPGRRELGVGAITLGGTSLLDEEAIRRLRIDPADLTKVEAEERGELERQNQLFRGGRPAPELRNRTVILVDDGLATGVTAHAAIRDARKRNPMRVVLAVPVAAPEAVHELRLELDDLTCIAAPKDFYAVGLWYRDFRPTTDQTVLVLLSSAARRRAEAGMAGEARPRQAQT